MYRDKAILLALMVLLLPLLNLSADARAEDAGVPGNSTRIFFFWGDGCPHCATEKPFLERLESQYPGVEVVSYEVWNNETNAQLFSRMAEAYGTKASGVPGTFIGDKAWIGYSELVSKDMEDKVAACTLEGCADPQAVLDNGGLEGLGEKDRTITLPIIGAIDTGSVSLFVITLLIAFFDGINPCSLWVLTFLLGIVIYSGSRKKILLVGVTFLTITTIAYGLFMIGLLNVFTYVGYLFWIRLAVAAVATIFALVNIKDYFWYKKGISFTISDKYKPKLFKEIRGIMSPETGTAAMLAGTAAMAVGVTLAELPCTAGLPVLWLGILNQKGVGTAGFLLLFLVYMVVFLLDEIAVFSVAAITMKATRFEEKHGRILKLVGGMIMLALAASLLFFPDAMNDVGSSVLVFAIALSLAILVLVIHRILLPRLGIRIGTEEMKKGR